ncbi:TPA: integrase, partial [Escherichia coli]
FRHTMISTCLAGWVSNLAHLQQVVGHEKSGVGITQRYLHTFPLSTVCYVIDGLCWET